MENHVSRGIRIWVVIMVLWACNGNQETKEGQRQSSQNKKDAKESLDEAAAPVDLEAGKRIYKKHCLACHQSDGSGVPGLYPPLRNTEWVNGDKDRLISIVVHGLQGEIKVNGEVYNNVMPDNSYLSDKEIANVLSYIRTNFENNADSILPDQVKKIRQQPTQSVRQ